MRVHVKDITDMVEYSNKNKPLIFKIIHKKIKDNLHDLKINKIFIWEAYLTEYSMVIENVAYRHEWENSLQLAIKYFSSIEEYEYCMDIQQTIQELKKVS